MISALLEYVIDLKWAAAGAAVCVLLRMALAARGSLRPNPAREAGWAAFSAYAAGVLAKLLAPCLREFGGYNLIPLRSIRDELTGNLPPHAGEEALRLGMYILLCNLLIFVPLGIFLPALFEKCRKWYVTASVCLVAAVSVEIVQYFIGRTADIDDVLLRLLGCMAAYAAYWLVNGLWKRRPADGGDALPAIQLSD